MHRVKRLLFLVPILAASLYTFTGKPAQGADCGWVSWTPLGGGTCVYSWCGNGSCEAEDCVYANGDEHHYISAGCGVSNNQ